jgi:hypothetical protein
MKDTSVEKEKKRKQKKEMKARKKQKREEVVIDNDDDENDETATDELKKQKKEIAEQVFETSESKKQKKKDKKKKKEKKKKKKKDGHDPSSSASDDDRKEDATKRHLEIEMQAKQQAEAKAITGEKSSSRIVASSAIEFYDEEMKHHPQDEERKAQQNRTLSLLLFYQYLEPVWDESTYHFMLKKLQEVGTNLGLTGRMRVAREGLNCTLTGTHDTIVEYCKTLRQLRPTEFCDTEFKVTTDLPQAQKFPNLKILKVIELVNYGLEGPKAPPIAKFSGIHLEPKDYHKKLGESNTVVIDVRNHYEAAIGRFVPPKEGEGVQADQPPPKWLDPKMRKSTEFPVWLDKPGTKEQMKGKQVLMYCTGKYTCTSCRK